MEVTDTQLVKRRGGAAVPVVGRGRRQCAVMPSASGAENVERESRVHQLRRFLSPNFLGYFPVPSIRANTLRRCSRSHSNMQCQIMATTACFHLPKLNLAFALYKRKYFSICGQDSGKNCCMGPPLHTTYC